MNKRLFLAIFIISIFISQFLFAQPRVEDSWVDAKVLQALLTELSGEIAKDHTIHISRHDRIQASEGWHDAALYIKEQLKKYGINDCYIEGWPSNGEIRYYTWATPIGWRASFGELWVVEPVKMRLASYEEIPTTMVKHSCSADVTTELVDVGSGLNDEEYEGIDVADKIVLATGYSGNVHQKAVLKYGAAGLVHYMPYSWRQDFPDLVEYTALWPRWSDRDKIGFGFNISKAHADMLKSWLKEGKKVLLKAKVKGEVYESKIEMMSALIKGSEYPEQEIVICGHLDHYKPGANDNASGSAGMLEIARTIQRLIDNGIIPQPKRTIHFLWVSEMYGTIAYLKNHPEFSRNTLAAINLDMIGEDLVKCRSLFYATRTPHSLPSYLNDVVEHYIELVDRLGITSIRGGKYPWNYKIGPYSGGSDHYMFCDGSIGVPAAMFGHPDPYHHTIQDTVEKVDPSELKRAMMLASLAGLFMANASDDDAIALAYEAQLRGYGRIALDMDRALKMLKKSGTSAEELHQAYKEAVNIANHSSEREKTEVLTCQALCQGSKAKMYIEGLAAQVGQTSDDFIKKIKDYYQVLCEEKNMKPQFALALSDEEKAAQNIVPRRNPIFTGPLAMDYVIEKLGDERIGEKITLNENTTYEATNFINGKRNLLQIRNALSAEYGPIDIKALKEYFAILQKAGLIQMNR
jgi:aminopeptidase YwaD